MTCPLPDRASIAADTLERRRDVVRVEQALCDRIICPQCSATLATFAERCKAPLDVACPGFLEIDRAKSRKGTKL